MPRYEYRVETVETQPSLEWLNALGAEGWAVVHTETVKDGLGVERRRQWLFIRETASWTSFDRRQGLSERGADGRHVESSFTTPESFQNGPESPPETPELAQNGDESPRRRAKQEVLAG